MRVRKRKRFEGSIDKEFIEREWNSITVQRMERKEKGKQNWKVCYEN